MHKLINYVCDKLEEIERKADKGDLSMSEIQYADTLAHLKKNLLKAEEMSEDGYSSRGYSRGDYRIDGSYRGYDDGRSYARRRDSMGRYSRRGYSMADEEMMSELHELMNDAPDEKTRQEFQKFIKKIESM